MIDGPFPGTGWLSPGEAERLTRAECIHKAEQLLSSRHTPANQDDTLPFFVTLSYSCKRVPGC